MKPFALLLPPHRADEDWGEFAERMPMELSDSAVDGYFRLAEKVDQRCPECRCFLTVDPETEATICPKCGWKEN